MKKTITENESKRKEFAEEMLILAGINHKNVVKLLGYCLEVKILMVDYEYIKNNTLSHYIHCGLAISFSECLRIATEVAKALAYLHDEIKPAIIHGDIKPSNILLYEEYMVKVADFEVYSFGVVLMEFLCRSKNIGSIMSRFISYANNERLVDTVHNCYLNQGRPTEQLVKVVKLAVKCMQLTREVRPSMFDHAFPLETIGRSVERSGPSLQQELVSLKSFHNPGYIGSTSSFSMRAWKHRCRTPSTVGDDDLHNEGDICWKSRDFFNLSCKR